MTYAVAMLNIDGTFRRRTLHTQAEDVNVVRKLAVVKFTVEPDEISVSCTGEIIYRRRET